MKYSEWMDRQAPSPALTHKLLRLRRRKRIWPGLAAAACCALAVGLLLHRDASAPSPTPTDPPSAPQLLQPVDTTPPEPSQTLPTEPMPDITYDADDSTPLANSLKHPDGWFQEPLTQAELESLLGPANWWQEAGQSLTRQRLLRRNRQPIRGGNPRPVRRQSGVPFAVARPAAAQLPGRRRGVV